MLNTSLYTMFRVFLVGVYMYRLFLLPTLEAPTYNCPCEKHGKKHLYKNIYKKHLSKKHFIKNIYLSVNPSVPPLGCMYEVEITITVLYFFAPKLDVNCNLIPQT